MSKEENKSKGKLLKFLIVAASVAVIIIITGLYFIYRLFEYAPPNTGLDFTKIMNKKIISQKAPISPDTARVFFTTDGRYLNAEIVEISRDLSPYERIQILINRLTKGPASKYFEKILPENVTLQAIFIGENEVTLDFSKELSENFQGGTITEMLTVYSIVNTVTLNVDNIQKVQIMTEGKIRTVLSGEIDISRPLSTNLNLIHW
jgi:sporulation and spore germination protein